MTVLQLISSSVGYYGAERVVVTLSSALAAQGAHVIVGAFDNTAKERHLEVLEAAKARGLETVVFPCSGRIDRETVGALRAFAGARKVDVIHSHGPKPNLYACLAARTGTPALVSTCHSWYFNSLIERLIVATDLLVLSQFDAVVTVSEPLRHTLRRRGVPRKRISTIHNGIDCAAFAGADGAGVRTRLPRDGVVVGAVARLSREKGVSFFIDSAALVLRDHPNTRFVIAGDGPEREALQAQVERLGISSRVALLGAQSDMAAFYANIDVFALPSLTEGMPMALIEAMAAGKPSVATAVGSVPVLIDQSRNGLLVTPGDAAALASSIGLLVADPDLRVQLGMRAQVTAHASFSAAMMATRYQAIYQSVAAHSAEWDSCAPSVTSTESQA